MVVVPTALIAARSCNTHAEEAHGQPLPRHPDSGIHAIWSGRYPDVVKLPFVRGGQVVVQWRDVNPQPGVFDFSKLERKLKALDRTGRKGTVQINGNRKPAWLFEQVPYHPKALHPQVSDKKGTLMYWHPRYVKAHTELVTAYASFVGKTPYKNAILGIRMNFNSIGTEILRVPPENTPLDQWKIPEGDSPERFSKKASEEYVYTVTNLFIQHFTKDHFLFVRNHRHLVKKYRKPIGSGQVGTFQTHSNPEPRSKHQAVQRCLLMEYGRSGKTYVYTESAGDAWGRFGSRRALRVLSPPQWKYWKFLADLHSGVSFIAVYGHDLSVAQSGTAKGLLNTKKYQDEFGQALQFAAKYAGYHASPAVSPGAWVALRQTNTLKSDPCNKLSGDYTFLMERMDNGKSRPVTNIGPREQRFGAWARTSVAGSAMNFRLNEVFAESLRGGPATLRLIYFDGQEGRLSARAFGNVYEVELSGSNRWKTAEFRIVDVKGTEKPGDAHISVVSNTDVNMHLVEVFRSSP